MPVELSPEVWAQIRHDYECTDKPVEDICIEHGFSTGTLRDRMRRWKWTRRRPPVPRDGPPPMPVPQAAPAPLLAASAAPSSHCAPQVDGATHPVLPDDTVGAPIDAAAIGSRLQSALARVPQAIEAVLANLGAAAHPRELERTARALTALTRTLNELNALMGRYPAPEKRGPEGADEFIRDLVRRMDAFAAMHAADAREPEHQNPPADATEA